MEKNLNITNPRYNEPISPVPWHFVKLRFHCIDLPQVDFLLVEQLSRKQVDGSHKKTPRIEFEKVKTIYNVWEITAVFFKVISFLFFHAVIPFDQVQAKLKAQMVCTSLE